MTDEECHISFTQSELKLLAGALREYVTCIGNLDTELYMMYVRICLHINDESKENANEI